MLQLTPDIGSTTVDEPRTWRHRAACRGVGSALFFPAGASDERTIEAAKEVCGRCPVSAECLEYAMDTNQQMGIWGGLTARDRRSLRRNLRRRAAG